MDALLPQSNCIYLMEKKPKPGFFQSILKLNELLNFFTFFNFYSPSTGIQDEEESCELGKQDLYQLNQWIQEAVIREQVLETKLGSLQRILNETREAAELGWTALMEEDRLLTRIESLENQLFISSKVFNLKNTICVYKFKKSNLEMIA